MVAERIESSQRHRRERNSEDTPAKAGGRTWLQAWALGSDFIVKRPLGLG